METQTVIILGVALLGVVMLVTSLKDLILGWVNPPSAHSSRTQTSSSSVIMQTNRTYALPNLRPPVPRGQNQPLLIRPLSKAHHVSPPFYSTAFSPLTRDKCIILSLPSSLFSFFSFFFWLVGHGNLKISLSLSSLQPRRTNFKRLASMTFPPG